MKRWRNGRNREGKNCPDMGISMSSNGRTMTLLHLPLNPIRAPSSAVAGSVIPPSVPAEKKKKRTDAIKRSLVRKMELGFVSHVQHVANNAALGCGGQFYSHVCSQNGCYAFPPKHFFLSAALGCFL